MTDTDLAGSGRRLSLSVAVQVLTETKGHASIVIVNDDLIKHCGQLSSKYTLMKDKLSCCWTINGSVMVKSVSDIMHEVHTDTDQSK